MKDLNKYNQTPIQTLHSLHYEGGIGAQELHNHSLKKASHEISRRAVIDVIEPDHQTFEMSSQHALAAHIKRHHLDIDA